MPKCIIWDFDGVILDSLAVRDYGFREILREFDSARIEELIAYHQRNGGLSRFHKIAYFFDEILHQPISSDEVARYATRFSEIMRRELSSPKYLIRDSLEFIERWHETMCFHIASGSEHSELNFLCQSLGIAKYFRSIHGSPTPKTDLVAQILSQNPYEPRDYLLIGDSINDYEAARANAIAFYGYNNPSLRNLGEGYIESFRDFAI
ncbi:HAD family hydrolase [uncultured Helicobacter sp.]|uniref:HAD family hydrolase n=1 Tax=uncultured Helicobacter sp. TaxID=175537 RepID=UPI00374EBDCC